MQHLKRKWIWWFISSDSSVWVHCLTLTAALSSTGPHLTIRPSGKSERGYNWRDLHAAKHVNIPVNVPDGCALIRIYVPHLPDCLRAGDAVFLPAGLNLLHPNAPIRPQRPSFFLPGFILVHKETWHSWGIFSNLWFVEQWQISISENGRTTNKI